MVHMLCCYIFLTLTIAGAATKHKQAPGQLCSAACLVVAGGDGPLKVHSETLAIAQQVRAHVVVQRMQLREVVLDGRACTGAQVGN